jgi:hypothetical protein
MSALLPKIWPLDLLGVVLPGHPNEERISLRAVVDVDLGEYFLITGWRMTNDLALPLNSDSFWFGKTQVAAGSWVVVYTGPGEQRMTSMPSGEPCLVLHWGKSQTLFTAPEVVPVLIHVDSVSVGRQLRPVLPVTT